MADETAYMRRALELAARGTGVTFPNPLVGAVVVSGGRIVGEGHHATAGGPHAETLALNAAGSAAAGGTIYLNLEPCCHEGRTPPCTAAIAVAGIRRVVFPFLDPDPRVRGRGAQCLREQGIEITAGLLAREALELNLPYVHQRLTGRPFIALKLALTRDGSLRGPSPGRFTCEDSQRLVHDLRARMEAIAVGIGTLQADDPELDRRLYPRALPPPLRMVFDSRLRFPAAHRWLARGERVIIYCAEGAGGDRRKMLRAAGAEVVALQPAEGGLDLGAWVDDVAVRGVTSVLVEGGGRIAADLMRLGIPDRLILFRAPVTAGEERLAWRHEASGPDGAPGDEYVSVAERVAGDDMMRVYDRRGLDRYLERLSGSDYGGCRLEPPPGNDRRGRRLEPPPGNDRRTERQQVNDRGSRRPAGNDRGPRRRTETDRCERLKRSGGE